MSNEDIEKSTTVGYSPFIEKETITEDESLTSVDMMVSLGEPSNGIVNYTDGMIYNSNSHIEVEISEGDVVYVKGYQHNIYYRAAYIIGDAGKNDLFPTASTGSIQEGTFTIPSGYSKIVVNGATGVVVPIVNRIGTKNVRKTALYCQVMEGELYTYSKYGSDKDIKIKIARRGPNNLPDFVSFYLAENDDISPMPQNTFALLMEPYTDFFSPFIVLAVNNDDGDKPSGYSAHFTGGNHSYENSSSGIATARCDNLIYKIDGDPITDYSGYCSYVEVEWDSFIQGNNTKKEDGTGREILKTHHHLKFDGDKWTVDVVLLPLEDVVIKKWYGLQLCGLASARYNKVRYLNASDESEYAYNVPSNSGNKTSDGIMAYGNGHKQIVIIDSLVGLGNRELYIDGDSQGAFTMTYGKSDFTIISGQNQLANHEYYLCGTYQFIPE